MCNRSSSILASSPMLLGMLIPAVQVGALVRGSRGRHPHVLVDVVCIAFALVCLGAVLGELGGAYVTVPVVERAVWTPEVKT